MRCFYAATLVMGVVATPAMAKELKIWMPQSVFGTTAGNIASCKRNFSVTTLPDGRVQMEFKGTHQQLIDLSDCVVPYLKDKQGVQYNFIGFERARRESEVRP